MPATTDQLNAMNLYGGMMEEIKLRINSIEFATSGLLQFHPVIIREFSYLQLRMICELISLGCLVAHGDIPATRSKTLSKAWHTEEIIKALEKLHSEFYPHPVEQVTEAPNRHHFNPIKTGFLTKSELLDLNGRAGDVLHRGNLRKLLAGPISADATYPDVLNWLAKVKLLMKLHWIALIGGQSHLICTFSAQMLGGKAQVVFAEAMPPPPP